MQPLFPHCWSVKHFILENNTYVYREGDFSDEDSYYKKRMVEFVNCLCYLEGGVPSIEANKKHLRILIDVLLLIGDRSC